MGLGGGGEVGGRWGEWGGRKRKEKVMLRFCGRLEEEVKRFKMRPKGGRSD